MAPPIKKVATKAVVRVHESRLKKKKHGGGGGGGGHDGGGALRWLLTYADMITLLLALFIILFAISTPNKVKYQQLVKEMSGGFGGTSPINTPVKGPEDAAKVPPTPAQKAQQRIRKLESQLKKVVAKLKMSKQVVIHNTSRGLVISLLTDKTSFNSGSAVLQSAGQRLLTSIGPFLKNINNEIRIEGNTDNIPIATAEYPSNWELSAARAVVVTRYLAEKDKLDARRLSAAGYGQYKPQEDNLTEDHRKLNRRVDIVILNTRLAGDNEKSQ